MKKTYIVFCILLCSAVVQAQNISIIAPQSILDTSITALTIADVQQLLTQACGCEVTVNDNSAGVLLMLPVINKDSAARLNHFAAAATFPYKNYPEHNYTWVIKNEGTQTVCKLSASSWQGVSFGLYGLLQEELGFRFYHPKESVIPHWDTWPLSQPGTFSGTPLFDKKGFHIHSEHPIELTEQLMDPTAPHALADVKQYIDWLVRNGQTYFEFCLLNDVDRGLWIKHAKAFVDYGHSRGILMAADLSLHMIQQKTFQLYSGPGNHKKQIEKNLEWLLQADWDFFNMEFSTAEFIAGNKKKKEELRQYIIAWLLKNSNTKLMGRQHVVRPQNELGHKHKDFVWDSASLALDKQRGVLSHTVMFYDMTEPNAPVYENKNQRHQFEFLLQQMKERETWYYPESAYWITFDNSIPMFLLPYLSARLSDIDTCVKYGVPGHITFSSGWEWGYWLFDWSIARWSWQYARNGVNEERTPDMYAQQIANPMQAGLLNQALIVQQQYLKDSTLMQWMTAMTVTDEIKIKALANEYEPRPEWSYKFLERKADDSIITQVRAHILPMLKRFGLTSMGIAAGERVSPQADSITHEWRDGIEITGLRALHRYYTLSYILDRREAALHKQHFDGDSILVKAASIRDAAQQIVNQRELHYRYPVQLLARQHPSHTAYNYGYLYMASNLHFWQREEEQARRNNYSAFFMNVWNIARIAGIIK
ncbi:MAG TPA: hypothetical protein VG603_00060 [Chitinophagales bacterium]|nr:hypothetical protein [Chitinophagales bacterium]